MHAVEHLSYLVIICNEWPWCFSLANNAGIREWKTHQLSGSVLPSRSVFALDADHHTPTTPFYQADNIDTH